MTIDKISDHNTPRALPFGKSISINHIKKNTALPFKDHVQFPMIVDILSRKSNHHLLLQTCFSPDLYLYFVEALVSSLSQETVPHPLRGVDIIYLDAVFFQSTTLTPEKIEQDFHKFKQALDTANKYTLLMFSSVEWLAADNQAQDKELGLFQQLIALLSNPKVRLMAFMDAQQYKTFASPLQNFFTSIKVAGPSDIDIAAILKSQRSELEQFHRVLIPEELLGQAYVLAGRYLSTQHTLEKALSLLDSSCARQAVMEPMDINLQSKPALALSTMTSVLSSWIQVPAANLGLYKFKLAEFIQSMNQKIFGQETAMALLGHELQQSHAQLQGKTGPFCSFLFAGPDHTGKQATAMALTEQLFKQAGALYIAKIPIAGPIALMDLPFVCSHDQQQLSLKELIENIPYAVLLFEHIDKAPSPIIEGIQEILGTGHFHGPDNIRHDFRQSILILSTTIGGAHLIDTAKSLFPARENESLDLIQLVMNEKTHPFFTSNHQTPQTMADDLKTKLLPTLPSLLCHPLAVVPFLPLSTTAIEKIIRLKLKMLTTQLDSHHQIELNYAPEVVRYITNEVMKKTRTEQVNAGIDQTLKQLYSTVEQAALNQTESQKRYGQLFLQLNDTGNMLRCDWLASLRDTHFARPGQMDPPLGTIHDLRDREG